jgi:hypothetical protein
MENIGFTCKKTIFLLQIFTFLYLKNEFRAKKTIRQSRGVAGFAVGLWTKFEAQLTQPC